MARGAGLNGKQFSGAKAGNLFGQDQLALTGFAQYIPFTMVLNHNLALTAQQLLTLHHRPGGDCGG